MLTSKEIKTIKSELAATGISLRRNSNLTKEQLCDLGKSVAPSGSLLEWDFGSVMEMKHRPEHGNYLFSDEMVPLHWDGAFVEAPAYIVFYCTNVSEHKGGESLFVNTTKLYDSLNDEQKKKVEQTKLRFMTNKVAHYGGSIEVDLKTEHRKTGAPILRIAAPVKTKKNPVAREVIKGDQELCELLDKLCLTEDFLYEHSWQKGDLLIVDNDTFLHGRNPLGKNTNRSFYRVQAL
jgi:alpha-ketoglutarate-dependent taurine dioxygenase